LADRFATTAFTYQANDLSFLNIVGDTIDRLHNAALGPELCPQVFNLQVLFPWFFQPKWFSYRH
jgi:hypothetical protein